MDWVSGGIAWEVEFPDRTPNRFKRSLASVSVGRRVGSPNHAERSGSQLVRVCALFNLGCLLQCVLS